MPSEKPGGAGGARRPRAAGDAAPVAGGHEPAPATERIGPLAVSRNAKADGRRLLLFSRVDRAGGSAGDRAGGEIARGTGERGEHERT